MQIQYLDPLTLATLKLVNDETLREDGSEREFKKINGAFRFVESSNYTNNFGFQWNKFVETQIDDGKKSQQSTQRLFAATGWEKENLEGKNILEVGSGAGRFSSVILKYTKGNLYSVDYSNAVEANFKNNGPNSRLHLFQASIYELPFQPGQFDKVFCFGVLQHTPDFKKSVECLTKMVKPGGELVVDFYPITSILTKIHAKYMLRPFTKKMKHERLLKLIENNIDWMIKAYFFFEKIGLGRLANRFIPICDIKTTFPPTLDKKDLREWAILDTFDMFSPEYDDPQRLSTVKKWFEEFGMKNVSAQMVTYGAGQLMPIVKGVK